jgi:hypothetical protein
VKPATAEVGKGGRWKGRGEFVIEGNDGVPGSLKRVRLMFLGTIEDATNPYTINRVRSIGQAGFPTCEVAYQKHNG